MAVTYRDLINRVLRAVSEAEIDATVDSLEDDYHRLVGVFVNMIKEEIEAATQWRALTQELTATITATTKSGAITGANERSTVLYIDQAANGYSIPLVFDTTDANNPIPLRELQLAEMLYRQKLESTNTVSSAPVWFAVDDTATDAVNLLVYPTPTTTRTIKVVMCVPQDHLTDDDLDVAIKIPVKPLELGAIWWALEERGEELGQSNIFTEERYRNALDAAVSRDIEARGGLEMIPT